MKLRLFSVSVCLASILGLAACDDPNDIQDLFPTRSFIISSSAMEPLLGENARFVASNVEPHQLRRGDVVVVRTQRGENYVMRLIGMPGDTIGMQDGAVVLNGKSVAQHAAGTHKWSRSLGLPAQGMETVSRRLRERLPGGSAPYYVLDERETLGDNTPPVVLGADEYFVLGDNRDYAADSRFPPEARGLGVVKAEQIKRRVDLSSIAE